MSAREILEFMCATKLAANPNKTKFLMFGRDKEPPLMVGSAIVEESSEEKMLGMVVEKSLSWRKHFSELETELRKRIGILRRLSHHLPCDVLCTLMQGIFTSKLLYGLPLISDSSAGKPDATIDRLNKLHRSAMKASLRIPLAEHPTDETLCRLLGQKSIKKVASTALQTLANACMRTWDSHPLTKERVVEHKNVKKTRQTTSRKLPPQPVNGSLITKMVESFESIPRASL